MFASLKWKIAKEIKIKTEIDFNNIFVLLLLLLCCCHQNNNETYYKNFSFKKIVQMLQRNILKYFWKEHSLAVLAVQLQLGALESLAFNVYLRLLSN